jgi:hypothetical protein
MPRPSCLGFPSSLAFAAAVAIVAAAPSARAATFAVPGDRATLQEAVRAAAPGDEIRLAAGRHCGAVIDRRLAIVGGPGATVVGCAGGPTLRGELRVGLLLERGGAGGPSPGSGTTVTGVTFDGAGVSADDLEPLAFGIYARFADDVVVSGNQFLGTVQAITNTAGHRWAITGNTVLGLSAFDNCSRSCGGGSAIVVQDAREDVALPGGSLNPRNRPAGNTVADNQVEVAVRPGFDLFALTGVLVLGADGTVVFGNRLTVPGSGSPGPSTPDESLTGIGVLVDNERAGHATVSVPGARETTVEGNDAQASQRAVVVAGKKGVNTEALLLERNLGEILVESAAGP